MQPIFMPVPTQESWKTIAAQFEENWHFPNCCGSLDGKHVTIIKPGKTNSSFFNYKKTLSVVLLANVDANYKFITIDVGSMGRFIDGFIFANSELGKRMENNTLGLPNPKPL